MKNIGFRASAISQKRISCETSSKFTMRERSYSCKSQWNTDSRTIRGGSENDPRMIRPHPRPSRTRRTAEVDHRGSGTDFVWKNIGFRASAISQKRISCETSSKFTMRERSYSCKSQWNTDSRMIRGGSENDPRMIRPHPRPSRTRRTAEVDHRGSGTDFVWKNIGFRASAISQKRISCENSSKFTMRERSYSCKSQWNTDSRMIRGGSENDPTTPETVSHPSHRRGRSSRFGDRLCMEKHRVSCICYLSKTHFVRDFLQIYNAGTILQLQIIMEYRFENDPRRIREWSENDPTTPETVSHPSHRRGRSSRFGDRLCMEKHRVSCICYLSKTHFVRDFLQIYNAGTILQLQITNSLSLTNSFFDYLFLWRPLSLTDSFFD